jgi:hypothetical protein
MPASCAKAQPFLRLKGSVGDARALLASQLQPEGVYCAFAETRQSASLAYVFQCCTFRLSTLSSQIHLETHYACGLWALGSALGYCLQKHT